MLHRKSRTPVVRCAASSRSAQRRARRAESVRRARGFLLAAARKAARPYAAVRGYTALDAGSGVFRECCSALTKPALDRTLSPVQAYAISCTLGHGPRVRGGNEMRRGRSRLWFAMLALAFAFPATHATHASLSKRVSGNLVFWDQSRGFDVIRANADLFSDISPFWYRVEADGHVTPYTTEGGVSCEDPSILSFLRANGILVIPTVANILNGVWDGTLVSRIIADPALTTVNIESLVQLAVTQGDDGIDLHYENLSASDRLAFTSFVNQLAVALHANGKLLAVNLYAKTSEPGAWSGPQAQDWWAIGQVVDQVRI